MEKPCECPFALPQPGQTASPPDPPNPNWILADGTWNDNGIWIDQEMWNDGTG